MAHGVVARADRGRGAGGFRRGRGALRAASRRRAERRRGAAQVCRCDHKESTGRRSGCRRRWRSTRASSIGSRGGRTCGGGRRRRPSRWARFEKARHHLDEPAEDVPGRRPSRVPDGPVRRAGRASIASAAELLRGRDQARGPGATRGLAAAGDPAPRQARPAGGGRQGHRRDGQVGAGRLSRLPGTGTIPRARRPFERRGQGGRGRLSQGAGAGPGPARGLPGARPRGRARIGARRGPRRSWTRAWRRCRRPPSCTWPSPTSSRRPAAATGRSTPWNSA